MSYEFDVFLSYRRTKWWPVYVRKLFLPMLDHWLSAELGAEARIYFDAEDIETGTAWPHRLATGLASSKVMLCLWSREYFASPWCRAELGHMLARRRAAGGSREPLPLILAAVLHDGKDFPGELGDIQHFPLQDCASPWIAEGSPKAEVLSDKVMKLAADLSHAIDRAPAHDPKWRELAIDEFTGLFERSRTPTRPPSLGIT
ncbi:toll/interleukin-1 receptor domain-containing protein [Actinosynnema sp. NPDC050801]|uniref:toll/interleukin-1 receptor domain-containing protein n=1 Tax=unclassified Actinosynnema TaxID=2637065 RepID=UPI0033F53256